MGLRRALGTLRPPHPRSRGLQLLFLAEHLPAAEGTAVGTLLTPALSPQL